MKAFANAWHARDEAGYGRMYELLGAAARARITQADFTARYQAVADRMFLQDVVLRVRQASSSGASGEVATAASYSTRYAGTFNRNLPFKMVQEGGRWLVDWTPGLILPELEGDRHLREEHQAPRRGRILTRDGVELAVTSDEGLTVGVVKSHIKDEALMLRRLSPLIGMSADDIRKKYADGPPDWFMPVRVLPPDTSANLHNAISDIAGVDVRFSTVRFYPRHTLASHLVGYVDADGVPRSGLEKSLDQWIGGKDGGRLYVVDGSEKEVATVAQRDAAPGLDAVLTLDSKVQAPAEKAMAVDPKVGVVAVNPATGELAAMASRPAFDPNDFALGNATAVSAYATDPNSPLLFRATSGQYPSGSTFKPITAAAALKERLLKPDEQIPCPHLWTGYGPPGQENHETGDLGPIDLSTALARSCNTYFYEVGKRLFEHRPAAISEMARSFGLGQSAHLEFVADQPGTVPSPKSGGDATNLAIGQGGLTVTPLQMARYVGALGSAGGIPQSSVVLRIQSATGTVIKSFTPSSPARADARPSDLALIVADLRRVAQDPAGTLVAAFRGERLDVYAKSGTAETAAGAPDIWFIGGAPSTSPTAAVAVVVEEKPNGVHSLDAAQVGRAVLEAMAP